jgi:superfamily II DNA or RNA helicase
MLTLTITPTKKTHRQVERQLKIGTGSSDIGKSGNGSENTTFLKKVIIYTVTQATLTQTPELMHATTAYSHANNRASADTES